MQAQVRLHLGRRAVDDATRERIATSFGAADDDQRSPAPLLWTRTSVTIPPFVGKTQVSISLPCTYDVEVATSAWLDQLPGGVMPLEISLDGTIFYRGEDGAVHSAMAPWWEHEIGFDLPVARWREALDRFFPESAWIRMGRRRFERLDAIRRREGLEDWDETIDALLQRYPSKNEAS